MRASAIGGESFGVFLDGTAMKSIVMVSGPVGAGKSAVARELAADSAEAAVYIEGDMFWSFIIKKPGVAGQGRNKDFKVVMTAMMAAAVPYAAAGYEVILDFSIPPGFLTTARAVAKLKDVPLHYVVLRPSEGLCAARAAGRSEGTIADYGPYREFYGLFAEALPINTISDDRATAEELAGAIRRGLKAGIFRVG